MGFVDVAGRIGAQKHLVAIRDSFATTMPLIIAGSLATVLNQIHLIFGLKESFLPEFVRTLNGNIWWGTFAMLTLFIVFLIGYNLAKSYEANPVLTGLVTLSSYLVIIPQVSTVTLTEGEQTITGGAWGLISWTYTQATSLFVGMFIALIAAEIFIKLSKTKALVINMPEGVPPAVARSFSALIPGTLTLYIVALIVFCIEKLYNVSFPSDVALNIFEIVNKLVASPIRNLADNYIAALVIAVANHTLWFFGLHGSNILEGILQPIYLPLLTENTKAFMDGAPIPHIVTKQMFDTYVYMGGSGTTLGLIIAIFIASKNKARRAIATLSAGPGLFNINEPTIFGLPIVLNPFFAIPFILTPLILTTTTYWALFFNLAGRTIATGSWATPPILSALITTDKPLSAIVLQLVNLAISVLIYLPFIIFADRADKKKEAENVVS